MEEHPGQKLEDVVMLLNLENKVKDIPLIVNNLSGPEEVFDGKTINFLDEISKSILSNKKSLKFPDLVTFAFWCRKSNLNKISGYYKRNKLVLGRGVILHIAPSNVPMNFCYSLTFGLLSGNSNIVRLPSRNFIQIKIFNQILKKITNIKKFNHFKNKICLVNYPKSDVISSILSKYVDGRIIWGGDSTVLQFKKYETSPRCVDINFPNRYSISLINTEEIKKLSSVKLKKLCLRFFNDCYLMDQQGCSSPQAIIWIKNCKKTKKKFWNTLHNIVISKYNHDISIANKKIASISETAVLTNTNFKTNLDQFKITRLNLKTLSQEIQNIQCNFGTFVEAEIKNINQLKNIITKKYQTITYFGVDYSEIETFISKNGIKGIDRIVPFGRGFDMSTIWDGYDIIHSLSRTVDN